nr:MAG TPA: hypothetical protein [Caudoviricetes sp.]
MTILVERDLIKYDSKMSCKMLLKNCFYSNNML